MIRPEVIKLVLDRYVRISILGGAPGICNVVDKLRNEDKITAYESDSLLNMIDNDLKDGRKRYMKTGHEYILGLFLFPPSDIQSRIAYLESKL